MIRYICLWQMIVDLVLVVDMKWGNWCFPKLLSCYHHDSGNLHFPMVLHSFQKRCSQLKLFVLPFSHATFVHVHFRTNPVSSSVLDSAGLRPRCRRRSQISFPIGSVMSRVSSNSMLLGLTSTCRFRWVKENHMCIAKINETSVRDRMVMRR